MTIRFKVTKCKRNVQTREWEEKITDVVIPRSRKDEKYDGTLRDIHWFSANDN